MGYKIRDDAPNALSLPVPVGGGDNSPTTAEQIYEIGEPIAVITTDILERFEAGDEHLVRFIEEVVEVDTREIEPSVAPGDIQSPEQAQEHIERLKGDPIVDPTPVAPEPEIVAETPASEETQVDTTGASSPAGVPDVLPAPADASDDNPFAA